MGGWSVEYRIGEQSWTLTGRPITIVSQIGKIQERNDIYEGDGAIWDWCNKVWCERDPKRCLDKGVEKMKTQSPVITFAHQLLSSMKNGLKPADIKLAVERGKICAYCPNNKKVTRCETCLKTVAAITKILIGKRSTVYDSKLKQCAICKCDLKQKIHYPLNEGDKNVYPANCWVTKEKNGG